MIYDHPLIGAVYRSCPTAAQNLFVSAYGLLKRAERRSETYRRYSEELAASQYRSPGELLELQQTRLKTIIRHCYDNVPYYRRLFDSLHLSPTDIASTEDLYKLPPLRKQDVRNHWQDLCARNIKRSAATVGRTGGTTGIPLEFLLDKARVVFDHALIDRHWSWAGYRPGDRVVILRGLTLIPTAPKQSIFWRYDWSDNRTYLSGFHLSVEHMPVYIRKLREWKVEFLAGYPSNLFTLARFMESAGEIVPVRAIFTSSEVLTPAERRVIERQFACKVWDRYGTGERLAVGQQCEFGNYHQNVEYGILQFDAADGTPARGGTKGELMQTTLTNLSMPFLRYASEDIGYAVEGECPCGRSLPLMGPVDGRKDDVIVTRDGRLMPRAGLDQIHEFVPNMERCQLIQEKIGEVIVRVVPRPDFNRRDEEELERQLHRRVGADTSVRVELVDKLDLTVTGKDRFIVSRVNLNELTGLQLDLRTPVNPVL